MTASMQIFISNARVAAAKLCDAALQLQDMQTEFNAKDYGNTLEDGTDVNQGFTKAQIGAAIFAGADAVVQLLQGPTGANVVKIK